MYIYVCIYYIFLWICIPVLVAEIKNYCSNYYENIVIHIASWGVYRDMYRIVTYSSFILMASVRISPQIALYGTYLKFLVHIWNPWVERVMFSVRFMARSNHISGHATLDLHVANYNIVSSHAVILHGSLHTQYSGETALVQGAYTTQSWWPIKRR